MPLKLLKFDVIHPGTYLAKKKKEWNDLDELSLEAYRERLLKLRSNYSDFYTYHLNQLGWEAEEFFLLDGDFLNKMAKKLWGSHYLVNKIKSKIKGKIRPRKKRWTRQIIHAYIQQFQPDVIFARSQPIASSFWQRYRDQSLLVARLSARLPRQWHPDDWDLLYVDLDEFKAFFEAHNVPTRINRQGFDDRINDELVDRSPRHDTVFVGGMGTQNFSHRTHFFEEIAGQTDFKWWGYWWKYGGWGSLDDFPNLKKSFQGPISGLEMYQLYKDSKIVLNDYVDTSKNIGFNQRMFEAMGVGAFMLTRQALNFERDFPENIFATFDDVDSCLKEITYYLEHPGLREEIAERAQKFVFENYHYADIVRQFDADLRTHLNQKN